MTDETVGGGERGAWLTRALRRFGDDDACAAGVSKERAPQPICGNITSRSEPVSTVRAKFLCEKAADGQIAMRAVYDPDKESENGRFFQATPSGQIHLSVVNPAAAGAFVEGNEYYVDFTPAT